MKKMTFILGMCFLFMTNANAQGLLGNWKVSKIGIANGAEQDMIRNMDYKYFTDQIPTDEAFALRDAEFDPSNYYDSICENPELALSLTLTNPRFSKLEWRNDIRYKFNRIDNIGYHYRANQDYSGDYVSFHGRHNELALESALGRVITIVNGLNLTPSLGSNIGFTRKNEVCVREVVNIDQSQLGDRVDGKISIPEGYTPLDECFNTGGMINHRLFVELKASLVIKKRAEIFLSLRKGVGYRVGNGHLVGTHGMMSNFGINWIFKNNQETSL